MPLFHSASKKAFKKNVETEMKAHPGAEHRAQNLAVAYSVKRRAAKHKMADGGPVKHYADGTTDAGSTSPKPSPSPLMRRGTDQAVAPDSATTADEKYRRTSGTSQQARDQFGASYAKGGEVMEGMSSSEYGKGQPGKRTPEPGDHYEMRDSEMGRGQPGMVKMARAQGEADAHAMLDSEMGHFAEGGMAAPHPMGGMRHHDEMDSEMGKGMPGMRIKEPMEDDLMHQQRLPGEMNRTPMGSIKIGPASHEADEHGMSSSEMGHFAHGGLAQAMKGNPKLQQAYKSAHEAVMAKHKAKMMADGGQVDIELNAMEEGEDSLGSSPLDKMDRHAADTANYDAGMKEKYGDDGEDEMHGESISERIRRKKSR